MTRTRIAMRKIFATSAIALLAAFTTARPAAADDPVNPPEVPGNLQVSSEFKAFLIGDAYGTQNYVCLPSATAPAGFAWTLYGPDATLFSSDDQQIVTHFLSPNPAETGTPARAAWQSSRDSSRVWAVMVQSSSDSNYVAPGAIPWFKLEVVGAQYGPNAGN